MTNPNKKKKKKKKKKKRRGGGGGGGGGQKRKRERELDAGRFEMFLPYSKSTHFMLRWTLCLPMLQSEYQEPKLFTGCYQ